MRYFNAVVQSNRKISEGWYEIAFQCPADLAPPRPGQFISLDFSCDFCGDFFGSSGASAGSFLGSHSFRKPLLVCAYDDASRTCTVMYGASVADDKAAANMLTSLKVDDTLRVMAFHGNGFRLPAAGALDAPMPEAALVSHGRGGGPLLFLRRRLRERGVSCVLYAGFATASEVPAPEFWTREVPEASTTSDTEHQNNIVICVDAGAPKTLNAPYSALAACMQQPRAGALYLCGPRAMMREGALYAARVGVPATALLMEDMACCVGACMGCAVPMHQQNPATQNDAQHEAQHEQGPSYKRACIEGPVFDAAEIMWDRARENRV